MPLGWSMPVPICICIWLTVPVLWRLQFSIDRLLRVLIFTFFMDKGGQILTFIFLTPKRHFLGENGVYWRIVHGDVSKNATCGRDEVRGKKKLSCVKLAIYPDHPRRCSPLKFCVRGRVREIVIYFKFHENRLRGFGAVGGRKSPSPTDKAHCLYNSLYYRTSRD